MNVFGDSECYYCGKIHDGIIFKHDKDGLIQKGWDPEEFDL